MRKVLYTARSLTDEAVGVQGEVPQQQPQQGLHQSACLNEKKKKIELNQHIGDPFCHRGERNVTEMSTLRCCITPYQVRHPPHPVCALVRTRAGHSHISNGDISL